MDDSVPAAVRDWAEIWRSAEKVVYSRALGPAPSARTQVERTFDPASGTAPQRDGQW